MITKKRIKEIVELVIYYAEQSKGSGVANDWYRHTQICKNCLRTQGEHYGSGPYTCCHPNNYRTQSTMFEPDPKLTTAARAIYRLHGGQGE